MERLLPHIKLRRVVSSTGRADSTTSASVDPVASPLFTDLPDAVRMKLRIIARASVSPSAALGPSVGVIVGGDPEKREAIVAAILDNVPLNDQWIRAWTQLRQ